MRKKLVLFCFALLALGVLLTAPAPVAAGCPTTCPIPDWPNWQYYCQQECGGCQPCLQECYYGMETSIQYLCTNCGVCCD
jgi:hypothetical protein